LSMAITAWAAKFVTSFDMLACERPDLLAIDVDCADQLIVLKHWHGDYRPIASEVDGDDYIWITLDVGLRCLDVGDVGHLLCDGETTQSTVRRGPNWLALSCLDKRGRGVVERLGAEGVSVVQVERAELGLADARGVLQHGLEHRLQLAGRAADYAQHLRRRCLLLQRFAQIIGAPAQFIEQPGVLD